MGVTWGSGPTGRRALGMITEAPFPQATWRLCRDARADYWYISGLSHPRAYILFTPSWTQVAKTRIKYAFFADAGMGMFLDTASQYHTRTKPKCATALFCSARPRYLRKQTSDNLCIHALTFYVFNAIVWQCSKKSPVGKVAILTPLTSRPGWGWRMLFVIWSNFSYLPSVTRQTGFIN